MLSKSARAVIRLQTCCTRQLSIFIIIFIITFPSSENQQKDKTATVKALFYKDLSGVHGKTQRNRMQVTLLCMEFMSARALRLLKR